MSLRSCGLHLPVRSFRSFPKSSFIFTNITCPIIRQQTFPHIPMERGVRPIAHPGYQPVLHWIEMDVIDVASEIVFIADRMFPEPPLPQCEIAIRPTLQSGFGLDQRAAEMPLDPPPSTREIRVVWRQGEQDMKMIREDHDRVDREGALATCHSEGVAKRVDMIHKRSRASVGQCDREEESATRTKIASIPDHKPAPPPDVASLIRAT
jgi:hypothetical protein